jgi:hypothetical protein
VEDLPSYRSALWRRQGRADADPIPFTQLIAHEPLWRI